MNSVGRFLGVILHVLLGLTEKLRSVGERKLLFYRKAMVHSNCVLRTLLPLSLSLSAVYFEYVSISCDKYRPNIQGP